MIDFNWRISNLERKADNGFVTVVHWRCDASDGEYSASTYSTLSFTEGDPEVPFADLTEATVVGWVKESLGEDTVEAALASQIEAQKAPAQIAGMPWA